MPFVSFAQNFEDVMIWRCLQNYPPGVYVDIGAQLPVVDSCTKALYDRGWRGYNIEPVEYYHSLLCAERPRDTNLLCAIGTGGPEVELFEVPGTGLSTTVSVHAEELRKTGRDVVSRIVPQYRLDEVVDFEGLPEIHLLKVDVEGAEADALAAIDFDKFAPWIVVVEATLPLSQIESHGDWENILYSAGYKFVYFDGLNRFYLSANHLHLEQHFLLPPNVFDSFHRFQDMGIGPGMSALGEAMDTVFALSHLLRGGLFAQYQSVAKVGLLSEHVDGLLDATTRLESSVTQLRQALTAQIQQNTAK